MVAARPWASVRAAPTLKPLHLSHKRRPFHPLAPGNPLDKGISGGQAKRTNIGIALIPGPRVLLLDEPTSGLDSFTANEVVALVRALTAEGVTVVATVHSPTAYAFSLFDG
jgi:ABC-type multidrug transport system ATPase subunit